MNEYISPHILEESANGMREISLRTKLFSDRKIFLTGDIDEIMCNSFEMQMLCLTKEALPIDIYINSTGGSIDYGMVIYDLIQSCNERIPINMYCTGVAASMGALILASGQKGKRFILKNSKCMIHEPLVFGGMDGSASSIKKTAEQILAVKSKINSILALHTGRSIKEIEKATSFNNWMTAEEAVAFGLVDDIRDII